MVVTELAAIMAVLVVLAALAYSVTRAVRRGARVSEAQSNLRQVAAALDLYFTQNYCYPPQGSDLTQALAPFVPDPQVFRNPLREEAYPGEDLNKLYEERSLANLK